MAVPLLPPALRRRCDAARLPFHSTAELPQVPEQEADLLGQDRAIEAVRFGIGVRHPGYNLFALGPAGLGKHRAVRKLLGERARGEPRPPDDCYVNNFVDAQKPRRLRLPSGRAQPLRKDMDRLIEELRVAVPAAFETESYRARKALLDKELLDREEQALGSVRQQAEHKGLALLRTPGGLALAPMREGQVLEPEAFAALPEEERERLEQDLEALQAELQETLQNLPRWQREAWEKEQALHREVVGHAVQHLLQERRARYADLPEVLAHLQAIEADLAERVEELLPSAEAEGGEEDGQAEAGGAAPAEQVLRSYRVNVLVSHGEEGEVAPLGAPVIYEDHPTVANLVGRIEHQSQFGALSTDFTLIRPGALHRANGGYLILDARRLLEQPAAWEELKRALRSREIRIEPPGEGPGQPSTQTLEPQPIPLALKVVLLGERHLYYQLSAEDPDFPALFKVAADFEEELWRTPEGELRFAQLVAEQARRAGLRPLHRDAVARVIEEASRLAGDGHKLSVHLRSLSDLLCEADFFAGAEGAELVLSAHVQQAVEAKERRLSRLRVGVREEVRRGVVRIETRGRCVGQINGLTVVELGAYGFGRPGRITARVRRGGLTSGDRGHHEVLDVEREVELGGPVHSKGVLILSGYLGGCYAVDRPVSLKASVVFEQSYEGLEGDSASAAELCALLSAIAEVPLLQGLAVTGAIDQIGNVQAVGGVNEKIEGFYDICCDGGLTGEQGVLIPASNVQHLMLRPDVVEACAEGRFHVYPVETVDQCLTLLCGMAAGERGPDGAFPEGSVNGRVEARLRAFGGAPERG